MIGKRRIILAVLFLVLTSLLIAGCGPKRFTLTVNAEGNGSVRVTPEAKNYVKGSTVNRTDGSAWARENVPTATEPTNTYSNNEPFDVVFGP